MECRRAGSEKVVGLLVTQGNKDAKGWKGLESEGPGVDRLMKGVQVSVHELVGRSCCRQENVD